MIQRGEPTQVLLARLKKPKHRLRGEFPWIFPPCGSSVDGRKRNKLIHPGRLTWNLKNGGWKITFLLGWLIFRGHVKLREGICECCGKYFPMQHSRSNFNISHLRKILTKCLGICWLPGGWTYFNLLPPFVSYDVTDVTGWKNSGFLLPPASPKTEHIQSWGLSMPLVVSPLRRLGRLRKKKTHETPCEISRPLLICSWNLNSWNPLQIEKNSQQKKRDSFHKRSSWKRNKTSSV